MVNEGLYQLNEHCQTRLKESATIPPSYGPAGVTQRGGARRHAFILLFLRSIIRAGLSTAFVHNDAASALPTTPVEVLTRCFFSLDRISSSTGPHAETRAILPVCSAFPFSALLSPLPLQVVWGARALPRRVWPSVSLRQCLVPPPGGKTRLYSCTLLGNFGILFCRIPLPVDGDTDAPRPQIP